ncbi:YHYH protein [Sansalvadorimonas sp. 2012CJ34-2]|uniref:YHYH protein n=1 Tax=Parendozoicomonas callyspongiae TaxID=2942213 RepID=A0ABT0PIR0_9GAMM|nr:YHYH protein [Sansalvadorimonas sp. 2012CJ34-2]MCL6271277.1 YHYH protein [Sansalvadorimonas sp. 2012CJ34-2]
MPPAREHDIVQSDGILRTLPANPETEEEITPLRLQDFGLAVNGVPFDPGAAEWYKGNRRSEWQYEPMSGAIPLGIDANIAHVQPTGAYHYHGLPELLLLSLGINQNSHSPLVGWAADGFPIYSQYGYQNPDNPNSPIVEMTSSYALRKGARPSGGDNPGGRYDGTFVADYVYTAGAGNLDECNGRFTVAPEFPYGTYAYFLTKKWPVIPRCFCGEPSDDFSRGPVEIAGKRMKESASLRSLLVR